MARISSFPSQTRHPWPLILLFLATLLASPSSPSPAKISYADHCSSIVPQSIPSGLFVDSTDSFQFSNGYFSGGDKLLSPDPNHSSSSSSSLPGYFYFYARNLHQTKSPGVIQLEGSLNFQGPDPQFVPYRKTKSRRRFRRPISFSLHRMKNVNFELSGFWSKSTGKLCMVGNGFSTSKRGTSLQLSAVFKFDYPKLSNISTSLIRGTVESLDTSDSPNHFDLISILLYAQKNYKFTQIPRVNDSCTHVKIPEESLGFDVTSSCSYLQTLLMGRFVLEYGTDCSGGNCNPFSNILGFSPSFITLNQIQCSKDGRVHMYIGLSNASNYNYNNLFVPGKSFVGEGFWDQKKKRLCLVACPILNSKNSPVNAFVGDCSIGFSLWFPSVLSIKSRSIVVGRIWSYKDKNDLGYFNMISFRSSETGMDALPGLTYEYTKISTVREYCLNNKVQKLGNKRYPDVSSVGDMRFGINGEGNSVWGYARPLSFGETFYGNSYMVAAAAVAAMPSATSVEMNQSLWNVSYSIGYSFFHSSLDVNEPIDISAEGIYDAGSGMLCMVGCRYLSSSVLTKQVKTKDSMDCEILINIQLSPLNPEAGEHHNGSIKSTREKSDPLYFEPLLVSSHNMYRVQALESIWRMDIEITMVVVSLSLSCVFIGFQLFHVKKHPDVLPSISITMLVVLTLGHVIPLFLNFEALFFENHNRQDVFSWSGGRLEVNEVIVRIMTMVAFLLQFRFLQSAWNARSTEEGRKGLWVAERKAIKLCLPVYFAGALIAWFVHSRNDETPLQRVDYSAKHNYYLSEDLISYAGLILDGFLLPQIILNILWNSKDKALSPVYYAGTTAVRALPHLYDAYRSRNYMPHFSSSYIYASTDGDFFSSAWDIIIPLEGVLFAVLIYLQQRFGGACFLPRKFRKPGGYETVPVASL